MILYEKHRNRSLHATDDSPRHGASYLDESVVCQEERLHTELDPLYGGLPFGLLQITSGRIVALTYEGAIALCHPPNQRIQLLQWQPVTREAGRLSIQHPELGQSWLAAGRRTLPNCVRRAVVLEIRPSRASLWCLHRISNQFGFLLRSHYVGGHISGTDGGLSLAAGIPYDAFWAALSSRA